MIIFKKRLFYCFVFVMVFLIGASCNKAVAQITPPPSSSSGVGQGNGPFNNTSSGGSASGSVSADASDPGGPGGNVDDNAPIDGGITILMAIALVHGYIVSRKKRNIPVGLQ